MNIKTAAILAMSMMMAGTDGPRLGNWESEEKEPKDPNSEESKKKLSKAAEKRARKAQKLKKQITT